MKNLKKTFQFVILKMSIKKKIKRIANYRLIKIPNNLNKNILDHE